MFKANQLFILSGVSDSVMCDYQQIGKKTVFTFCHAKDKAMEDLLIVTVQSDRLIDKDAVKQSFNVSYSMGAIQQAESDPLPSSAAACGVIVAIVNDVFPLEG